MTFDKNLFNYVLDATEDFESKLKTAPVVPNGKVIDDISVFEEPTPEMSTPAIDILTMLHEYGSPAATLSRSGRFFGFVVGGALPVSIAANWLGTVWDQNLALTVLGKAASKIEDVTGKWIFDMLGFPENSGIGYVSGATMAGFTALNSARYKLYKNMGYNVKKSGIRNAPKIRFVISEDIHPTNLSALHYMGYGLDDLEFTPVDGQGRIIIDQMPKLDDKTVVMAQAGNINTGAFDDFTKLAALTKKSGSWFHIDGAFGGWVKLSHKRNHLTKGMELADSISIDCHKWLNVPYDSAIAICRDKSAMRDFFGVEASYLIDTSLREPSHFTPELSRRARGIDVWAALKHLGKKGFGNMIDQCCDHAYNFSKELEKIGFTIMNDVVINQVVFCLDNNDDTRLKDIMTRVQDSGKAWFGPTKWQGRTVYRMSVSSFETTQKDLEITLNAIKEAMK